LTLFVLKFQEGKYWLEEKKTILVSIPVLVCKKGAVGGGCTRGQVAGQVCTSIHFSYFRTHFHAKFRSKYV